MKVWGYADFPGANVGHDGGSFGSRNYGYRGRHNRHYALRTYALSIEGSYIPLPYRMSGSKVYFLRIKNTTGI